MALTQAEVSQLYVSLFGRASEGEGNKYWMANAADMVTSANNMLDTQAAKDYFGDTINDNQKFVEFIYLNTLGKTYADDKAGVDYWVAELEGGKSMGEVSVAVITSAQDPVNAGDAQDQFNNKVDVSNDAADKLEAFTSIEAFTSYVKDVDHTEDSVTAATALVDDAVPQTYTLTSGAEEITGQAGPDTFNGVVSGLSSTRTLDAGDVLDGAGGTDTLAVSMSSSFAGLTANVGSITNIEILDLTNVSDLSRSFNAATIKGLETIKVDTNDQSFTVSNLAGTDLALDISNADATKTVTLGYAATVNDGTADSLTVTLNDVGTAKTTTVAQKTVTLAATGVEALTLASAGTANFVNAAIGTSKTVSITGAGDLTVTGVDTSVTEVDASAATGDLSLSLNGATIESVKTGSGDDKVTVNSLNIEAVLDGGAGSDTLVLAGIGTGNITLQPAMIGFETLAVSRLAGVVTFAGSGTTDLAVIAIVDRMTSGLTVAELSNSAITIAYSDSKDTANVVSNANLTYTGVVDLTVVTSTNNTSGTVRVYDDNIIAAKATSVDLTLVKGVTYDGTITAAKASSVTVTSTNTAAIALDFVTATATSLTVDAKSDVTFDTTTDLSAIQNVTFVSTKSVNTNNAGIVLGNGFGDKSSSVSIDASGVKGAFTTIVDAYAAGGGVVDIVGSTLAKNTVIIETGRNEVSVTGSLLQDIVTLNQAFAVTDELGMSFDLGTVSTTDQVIFSAGGNITNGTTTFVGVNTITTGAALTLDASSVSAQTIAIAGAGFAIGLEGTSGADTITLTGVNLTGVGGLILNAGGGNDTIKGQAASTSAQTINGEAGNDTITLGALAGIVDGGAGNDIITGGAGNDSITGGAGNDTLKSSSATDTDTFVFAATGALNGSDTITDFTGTTGLDILNVNAFLGAAGTVNTTVIAAGSTANIDAANDVNWYDSGATTGLTTTNVAALFQTTAAVAANVFLIADSGKAVIVSGDSGTEETLQMFYVDAALDGTVTDVSAADVVLVGTISGTTDFANLAPNNFIF